MLIGVVVDERGLVPEIDVKRMKEFGDEIKKRFDNPIARKNGKGNEVQISFKNPRKMNHVVVMEDIEKGERVREFEILGKKDGKWISLFEGSCIGHKYIHQFEEMELISVKLVVTKSTEKPIIRDLSVYYVQ